VEPLFEFRGVSKRLGSFILEEVSFSLPRGYIGGLIGPNGAGKTTLLRLLLGLSRPDRGEVRLFGQEVGAAGSQVRGRVGFVHELPTFPAHLSAERIAATVAPFYPLWDQPLYEELLAEFAIPARQRFGACSHGEQTKVALAVAMSHHAELLILDEPTTGLDPVFRSGLLDRLAAYLGDGQASVLFSTHITTDLERVADFVTFVRQGRIVFSTSQDEVMDRWWVVRGAPDRLDAEVRQWLAGWEVGPHAFAGLTAEAPSARQRLLDRGLVLEPATLDDILYFTGRR
jgi:ABC-2 type transport system ATP-binding protein